ncbi:hypothetical protein [Streptomyces sp. NPDC002215]|uniref:hypothetical protein n=1 Tax=Streptomyces sp. NPDC002215 TaxID=3154412 RepID=UPI00332FC857
MPTTSYGFDLVIGDEAGLDDIPVCCGNDMTGSTDGHGGLDYLCGTCETTVTVSPNGLVFDITSPDD